MRMIIERIATPIIELVYKSYCQSTNNFNRQSWDKINTVNLVCYVAPDPVRKSINDDDDYWGYYEVPKFQLLIVNVKL